MPLIIRRLSLSSARQQGSCPDDGCEGGMLTVGQVRPILGGVNALIIVLQ